MGAKIITILVTFTLLSATLAAVRFNPDRYQTSPQRKDPFSRTFLPEITERSGTTRNLGDTTHSTTTPVTMRLKGSTDLGYYYVSLFFGTPIQRQTLIVDTGSMTTVIPCTECGNNCGKNHFNQPFNNNNSASFQSFNCDESFGNYKCSDCLNKCAFLVAYQEGSSYYGHFNKDYVVFGNEIEDNYFILKYADANVTSPSPIDLDLDTSGNETTVPDFALNTDPDQNSELRAQQAVLADIIEKRKVYLPFGCTYRETKLFYEQEADGILGLGILTNNEQSPPNLLDALSLTNDSYTRAFSLCLAQDGGYFSVNGYNHAYHTSENIQYTEYFPDHHQYRVVINKVQVDDQFLSSLSNSDLNKGQGSIVDSGTTMTYFPSVTYKAMSASIQNFCSNDAKNCANGQKGDNLCWKYKSDTFPTLQEFYNTFPTIKFYFGENGAAEYDWKPEDYFYEKDIGTGKYCVGMATFERETILGATFMKNHDFIFDKDTQTVGMVRANCSAVLDITTPQYSTEHPSASSSASSASSASPSQDPESELISESTKSGSEPGESENAPTSQAPDQKEPSAAPVEFTEMTQVSVNNDDDNYWRIILLAFAVVAISALVGTGIFLIVRYSRKENYNDMSGEVEVPGRRDGTSADTSMENPQLSSSNRSNSDVQAPKMIVSV